MEPTFITDEDLDAAHAFLLEFIKSEGYSEASPPIDEDWYRVFVNNKFLDLCISFDHNEGTVYDFLAYFYGLKIGLNILGERDYTTNFNNHERFVFSADYNSVLHIHENL